MGEGDQRTRAGSHDREEHEDVRRDTDAGQCSAPQMDDRQVQHGDGGEGERPAGGVRVQRRDQQRQDRLGHQQGGVSGAGEAGEVLVPGGDRGGDRADVAVLKYVLNRPARPTTAAP
jgi:hypothetical protein